MSNPNDFRRLEQQLEKLLQQQAEFLKAGSGFSRRQFWLTVGLATVLSSGINGAVSIVTKHLETKQQKELHSVDYAQRDSDEAHARVSETIEAASTIAHSLEGKSDSQQAHAVRVIAQRDPTTAAMIVVLHPTPGTIAGAQGVLSSKQLPTRDTALLHSVAVEYGGPEAPSTRGFAADSDVQRPSNRGGPSEPQDVGVRARLAVLTSELSGEANTPRHKKRVHCQIWEDPYGGTFCSGPCAGSICGEVEVDG